jgi:hypothetical protein
MAIADDTTLLINRTENMGLNPSTVMNDGPAHHRCDYPIKPSIPTWQWSTPLQITYADARFCLERRAST